MIAEINPIQRPQVTIDTNSAPVDLSQYPYIVSDPVSFTVRRSIVDVVVVVVVAVALLLLLLGLLFIVYRFLLILNVAMMIFVILI